MPDLHSLMTGNLLLATTRTAVNGYQLALPDIELLLFNNLPLMKATATECLTLVLLLCTGALEPDYITQTYPPPH